ncbi:MAG: YihY/virulence factor BrkB family protein [Clostridia bacterium]|nr:YihY/virulence factor BrkB family protein [Clostridia bacterium]
MREFVRKQYNWFKDLIRNISNDHVSEFTAECSYYTILSFIPFVISLITLIQFTNISQQTLFEMFSKIIPASMNEIVLGVVQEVYSKSIGTISISIIFTLWSAGKGLYALTKGMQSVYKIEGDKYKSYLYLRIRAIIETVIFIILIATGLTLLVFGDSLISIIKNYFGRLENFTIISGILTEIAFLSITFLVFLLLYKFMPKHKLSFKSQIPGAIFGAVTLNIVSFVFSQYLNIFKGFSITYGSLTTLMLIMMWTYACFYIAFLGAEINKMVKSR